MTMSIIGWQKSWNDIIRYKIFQDAQLKTLMNIPADTTIIDFIDKYFIKAGYSNKILKDECARIVYSDGIEHETDIPNVNEQTIMFDIYVKQEYLHNYGNDRLLFRTHLIADRIGKIQTGSRYLYGYRFWIGGDWDMGTRTNGYARYCVSFHYMKVY